MTVFIIRPEDEAVLKAAADLVRDKPIPWSTIKPGIPSRQDTDEMTLADRVGVPDVERPIVNVMLPLGWRVAISCEEQPAGILLHVSMSSPRSKDRLPRLEAMHMVVKACGLKAENICRTWIEEYEPGKRAVNVLVLLVEYKAGAVS